jgi:hypothetical protein
VLPKFLLLKVFHLRFVSTSVPIAVLLGGLPDGTGRWFLGGPALGPIGADIALEPPGKRLEALRLMNWGRNHLCDAYGSVWPLL